MKSKNRAHSLWAWWGERYGWIPSVPPVGGTSIAADRERSITDIEMQVGALRASRETQAFFYIRDPAYIDSFPEETRDAYREMPIAADPEVPGADAAEVAAGTRRAKLALLKQQIRSSGFPVLDGYRTPGEMGEDLLVRLTAAVDRIFPVQEIPDEIARQVAEQLAFARRYARAFSLDQAAGRFIGYFMRDKGGGAVVLGESGSGKTALLANWSLRAVNEVAPAPEPAPRPSLWRRLMGRAAAPQVQEPAFTVSVFAGAPLHADRLL